MGWVLQPHYATEVFWNQYRRCPAQYSTVQYTVHNTVPQEPRHGPGDQHDQEDEAAEARLQGQEILVSFRSVLWCDVSLYI